MRFFESIVIIPWWLDKLHIYHAGMYCGVNLPYLLLVPAFPGNRLKVTDKNIILITQAISIANHKSHLLHPHKWLADVLVV